MKTTFIYALNCPSTGDCRYVGKANDPQRRFVKHVSKASNGSRTHVACWIKGLLAAGAAPVLEILQEVPNDAWRLWERTWIKASREIGYRLTNLTVGGDGVDGLRHSAASKKAMSLFHTGKKLSESTKEKLRKIALGKTPCLGHKQSDSHKQARLLGCRGIKRSDNASGFVGVSFKKEKQRWEAYLNVEGKRTRFGNFKNFEDAVFVRRLAEGKYFG